MRSGKRRGKRGLAAGAAAAAAALLFGVTAVIRLLAGDAAGMEAAMLRYAPPARTGLPASAYGDVAAMTTGYLTDRVPEFQYTRQEQGESVPAFHDYEAAHMADCRSLIRLDTAVCGACFLLAAGLILREAAGRRKGTADRKAFFRGARLALLGAAGAAAVLGAWALADFEGLFVTFHRAAFRNDLWLLDPRTDLLIRLMPEELFVHLGEKGLALAAGWAAAETAVLAALGRRGKREPET